MLTTLKFALNPGVPAVTARPSAHFGAEESTTSKVAYYGAWAVAIGGLGYYFFVQDRTPSRGFGVRV